MASKNWKWVIDVWYELEDPPKLDTNFVGSHAALEHWVQWTTLSEHQFEELAGKLPEKEKTRRRLGGKKKSRRSRPTPPLLDWTLMRREMTPRLIHDCMPVLIKAQKLSSLDMHMIGALMRPSMDHTCHWRLRNVMTKETIPGILLVE